MSQDMEMLDSLGFGMADNRVYLGIGQRADDRNGGGSGEELPNARNFSRGSYGDRINATAVRRAPRQDRLGLWLHRRYLSLALGWPLLLLALAWRLFEFAWVFPVAMALWASGLVTAVRHRRDARLHYTGDPNCNNLPVALLTKGEAWHDNHHAETGRAVFHPWLDVGVNYVH